MQKFPPVNAGLEFFYSGKPSKGEQLLIRPFLFKTKRKYEREMAFEI
jgi:hypothetical protein